MSYSNIFGYLNPFLGYLILLLAFLSYFPQIVKVIQNKSVIGISYNTFFIACVNSFTQSFQNGLDSYDKVYKMEFFHTRESSLSTVTFFYLSFILNFVIISLYTYYYFSIRNLRKICRIVNVTLSYLFLFSYIVILILLSSVTNDKKAIDSIIVVLVVISSICSMLQWIPQIITMCYDKGIGSFSLVSLFLSSLTTLILIIWGFVVGSRALLLLSNIISFILQIVLAVVIFFVVYYSEKEREYLTYLINNFKYDKIDEKYTENKKETSVILQHYL